MSQFLPFDYYFQKQDGKTVWMELYLNTISSIIACNYYKKCTEKYDSGLTFW